MNLLLLNSKYVEFHTHLKEVFCAVPEFQAMDWVISGHELNITPTLFRGDQDPVEINGGELLAGLNAMEYEPQFIWGVLSAFTKGGIPKRKNWPHADGNERYWRSKVVPEVPEAICEIVCFDSTLTMFIGVSDKISEKLKILYPDIKDLDEYNKIAANQALHRSP